LADERGLERDCKPSDHHPNEEEVLPVLKIPEWAGVVVHA
jgi:hypothetical protein